MKRWEYKFVEISPLSSLIKSEREFESLGKEGWELTTTYQVTDIEGISQSIAIFKTEVET
jgi:hypothetical protein